MHGMYLLNFITNCVFVIYCLLCFGVWVNSNCMYLYKYTALISVVRQFLIILLESGCGFNSSYLNVAQSLVFFAINFGGPKKLKNKLLYYWQRSSLVKPLYSGYQLQVYLMSKANNEINMPTSNRLKDLDLSQNRIKLLKDG